MNLQKDTISTLYLCASPLVGGLASAPVHTRDSEHGRRLDNFMAGQKMGNDRDEWREEALQAKHESGGSDIARQKRCPFLRRHSAPSSTSSSTPSTTLMPTLPASRPRVRAWTSCRPWPPTASSASSARASGTSTYRACPASRSAL